MKTPTLSDSPFWYLPHDGFPMVDPNTTRAALVAHLAAGAEPVDGTRWLAGIATSRHRVRDAATGKRVTRDSRTAIVVLWTDVEGAPTLDLEVYRQVLAEIRAAGGADHKVIYGRTATVVSPTFAFEQFGVRARVIERDD